MAEFKKIVITKKGQALMAKMMAGTGNIAFTKVSISDTTYTDAQLESLTSLTGIKQSTLISKITRVNDVSIKLEAAITNADLKTGYYMRTVGVYANDPQDGEILYGVINPNHMNSVNLSIFVTNVFLSAKFIRRFRFIIFIKIIRNYNWNSTFNIYCIFEHTITFT